MLSKKEINLSGITLSNCGEAESCMKLHICHAIMNCHKKVFLQTINSDVITLSVHVFKTFQNYRVNILWTGFGIRKIYTNIRIQEVSLQLGPIKCEVLLSSMILQIATLCLAMVG